MLKAWAMVAVSLLAAMVLAGCASTLSTPSRTTSSIPVSVSRRPPSAIHRGRPAWVTATHPMLSTMHLAAAAFSTTRTAFVSGTYAQGHHLVGFVESSGNGGRTWDRVTTIPGELLTDLTFANAQRGWAVGAKLPARVSENANTWSPTVPQGAADVLWRTVNGGHTWDRVAQVKGTITAVLIEKGTPWLSVSGPCTQTACPGRIVKPVGGVFHTVWQAPGPVLSLSRHRSRLFAEVLITGSTGALVQSFASAGGGAAWTRGGLIARVPGIGPGSLLAGQMVWTSTGEGLAAVSADGIRTVARTDTAGARWATVTQSGSGCVWNTLIAARQSQAALAETVNLAQCPAPGGQVLMSQDGGRHFTVAKRWASTQPLALGFGPQGQLWAVTSRALIVSHDGAHHWQQQFPAMAPTGIVRYVSPQVAFGAGDQANPTVVLNSRNGGQTWQRTASLSIRQAVAMAFPARGGAWMVATPMQGEPNPDVVLLHRLPNHRNWSIAHRSALPAVFDPALRFFSPTRGEMINLPANCPGNCQDFEASTRNGGRTWQVIPVRHVPAGIASAAILTPRTVIVAALGDQNQNPVLYCTRDAGQSWQKLVTLPSDLNGGLSLAFPTRRVGYMLVNDVISPAGNGHAQRAVLALLKTTDGGRRWTLHDLPRIPDAWFASVSFATDSFGLITVGDGTVWKTTDGGQHWFQMP